jgi:hypothetical protein
MSDTTPATDAPDTADQTDTSEPDTGDQGGPDLTAEVEKWKAQARKHEERAKANAKAAQELDEFRKQSMSETEKAIELARTEGRREALTEAGGKVAAAEIRAAATGRMNDEQVSTLLENVNLARFVDDAGEVDRDAVVAFVDGIAPQPTEQPTVPVDLGQGARTGGTLPLNGDPLLRDLKSKLGI